MCSSTAHYSPPHAADTSTVSGRPLRAFPQLLENPKRVQALASVPRRRQGPAINRLGRVGTRMRHRAFFFCSRTAPAANYIRPPTNIFLLLPIASSRWLLFSNVTCLSIMCSTYATASVPRCTRCGIQVRKKKKKKTCCISSTKSPCCFSIPSCCQSICSFSPIPEKPGSFAMPFFVRCKAIFVLFR